MNIEVMPRTEFEQLASDAAAKTGEAPRVLHLGSRLIYGQIDAGSRLFPSASQHVGLDFIAGPGVDVVADIHSLGEDSRLGMFDVVWSDAVLEHLERPWVAAAAMAKVTRIGGVGFHITHQSFPLHAVPNDYWRFSTEGLRVLFCQESGWETIRAAYCWPCAIVPFAGEPCPPAQTPCFVHAMVLARRM
jgi:hypothetical protein